MKRKDDLIDRLSKYDRLVKGEDNLMKALQDIAGLPVKTNPTKKRYPVAPQPKPRKIEL